MSFRLFIYYCAILGGWAGYTGWLLGRFLAPGLHQSQFDWQTPIRGLWLGLAVAFGVGIIDAAQNVGWRRIGSIMMRTLIAVVIGSLGGFLGGLLGSILYNKVHHNHMFFVAGWTLTGMLVGMSIAAFDFLSALTSGKDRSGAMGKLVKCIIGGTLGGMLGGMLAWSILSLYATLFGGADNVAGPTAAGFVAVGILIGLLVGLAQVILKEAWIKVEAGFRPGREMILAKDRITIGRAEGMDIALFGDQGVEKTHAYIVSDAGRYYLEDAGSPGGTFVNDQRVNGRVALKSQDMIKLGTRSMLRFFEKQKRRD